MLSKETDQWWAAEELAVPGLPDLPSLLHHVAGVEAPKP